MTDHEWDSMGYEGEHARGNQIFVCKRCGGVTSGERDPFPGERVVVYEKATDPIRPRVRKTYSCDEYVALNVMES